ncbi:MAG: hypothetical protein IAE67_07085 [Candidatus Competibacteraceae bacterium]|nr:hypothetical protein [Candidatus Competibacteraceae bacterium]
MNKRLIVFLFFIVSISIKSEAQIKTAQFYYEYVVGRITQAIGNDTLLAHALLDMDHRRADSARQVILSQINNSHKAIKDLEPFRDNQTFKNATADLLFFYKTVFEKDYARLVVILSHATYGVLPDNELREFDDILNSIDRREQIVKSEFDKERMIFIEKYQVKIKD